MFRKLLNLLDIFKSLLLSIQKVMILPDIVQLIYSLQTESELKKLLGNVGHLMN